MFGSNAVGWLKVILENRFGLAFDLDCQMGRSNVLVLTLPGHSGQITFDTLCPDFWSSNNDFPCAQWDPRDSNLQPPLGLPIPAPAISTIDRKLCEFHDGSAVFHYDVLGLTYWCLNRLEELEGSPRDLHGRYPAFASHAVRNGYLDRPIVDEWLMVLGQVIAHVWPGVPLRRSEFAIRISHDVDWPGLYNFQPVTVMAKSAINRSIVNRSLWPLIIAPVVWLFRNKKISRFDPANTFDWLMDVSDELGLTNAFYFVCGETNANYDPGYSIDNPSLSDLIGRISGRGHEIGLHPSYETFRNPTAFNAEFSRLRQVCEREGVKQETFGGRMHFLRWDQAITPRLWAESGLSYDSSLGYAEKAGFRCGTCHDFPVFDHQRQEMLSIIERPLIAMETTLFDSQYMAINNRQDAFSHCGHLMSHCKEVGGNFNFLWHNSGFKCEKDKDLYSRIVHS